MTRYLLRCTALSLLAVGHWPALPERRRTPVVPVAVVVSPQGSFAERLAAQEIRRYVYLRTATLLPIVEDPAKAEGGLIVVGSKDRPAVKEFLDDASLKASVEGLAAEQYLLRSIRRRRPARGAGGRRRSDRHALRRLSSGRALGVRFYLTATCCLTTGSRWPCRPWTRSAGHCSIGGASSRSTIFRRVRTGGTRTTTRRSWPSCPSSG